MNENNASMHETAADTTKPKKQNGFFYYLRPVIAAVLVIGIIIAAVLNLRPPLYNIIVRSLTVSPIDDGYSVVINDNAYDIKTDTRIYFNANQTLGAFILDSTLHYLKPNGKVVKTEYTDVIVLQHDYRSDLFYISLGSEETVVTKNMKTFKTLDDGEFCISPNMKYVATVSGNEVTVNDKKHTVENVDSITCIAVSDSGTAFCKGTKYADESLYVITSTEVYATGLRLEASNYYTNRSCEEMIVDDIEGIYYISDKGKVYLLAENEIGSGNLFFNRIPTTFEGTTFLYYGKVYYIASIRDKATFLGEADAIYPSEDGESFLYTHDGGLYRSKKAGKKLTYKKNLAEGLPDSKYDNLVYSNDIKHLYLVSENAVYYIRDNKKAKKVFDIPESEGFTAHDFYASADGELYSLIGNDVYYARPKATPKVIDTISAEHEYSFEGVNVNHFHVGIMTPDGISKVDFYVYYKGKLVKKG